MDAQHKGRPARTRSPTPCPAPYSTAPPHPAVAPDGSLSGPGAGRPASHVFEGRPSVVRTTKLPPLVRRARGAKGARGRPLRRDGPRRPRAIYHRWRDAAAQPARPVGGPPAVRGLGFCDAALREWQLQPASGSRRAEQFHTTLPKSCSRMVSLFARRKQARRTAPRRPPASCSTSHETAVIPTEKNRKSCVLLATLPAP